MTIYVVVFTLFVEYSLGSDVEAYTDPTAAERRYHQIREEWKLPHEYDVTNDDDVDDWESAPAGRMAYGENDQTAYDCMSVEVRKVQIGEAA